MNEHKNDEASGVRWIKAAAAARYAAVSTKTLYAAARRGDLRAARIGSGRNMIFNTRWLDLWLERCASSEDGEAAS